MCEVTMSDSSKTHSQDSFHARSQAATDGAYEDTASSVHTIHQSPGSSATFTRRAPNAAFLQRTVMTRSRSASPGPVRSLSPLGALVAKRRSKYAERTVVSAMSGVGQVTNAVRVARAEAATAVADAQSAMGMVQTLTMSLSAHTEAATAKPMGEMEKRVQQVASYSDAQTSQAIATLRQELESEIVSVVASADETTAKRTRDVEECIQRKIETKFQQE